MGKIDELKFDDKNFNKHTEYGMSLLEKSLRENGAGRSILIDKDNNIIAGNGIVEAAGQIGLENVKVVETTGDEIVAVKRTDVSLNSHQGRRMALADNATAKADLEWDEDLIKAEFTEEEANGWGVDLDWDTDTEVEEDERPDIEYLLLFRKNAIWNNGLDGVNYSRCLEFGRELGLHPTMKPIELICNEMKISSNKGSNVLDLFGGSGSTLIACEQLGRKCYMMELDPKYCDVIRKRYWKLKTGSEEGWQDGTKADRV